MRSATCEPVLRQAAQTSRDLLVLWQQPKTREILVVGLLGFDGEEYSFAYTRSSARAFELGFRGLPGLRRPGSLYRSDSLFPVFAQRTLDPTRADYHGFLRELGLDERATPLEQIIYSGGYREADTVQLLEKPHVSNGVIDAVFLVHGVRHVPYRPFRFPEGIVEVQGIELERSLGRLRPGDTLTLREEPGNEADPRAIVVTAADNLPLGYVPKALLEGVHALRVPGAAVTVSVKHVNGPDAPAHLRLLAALRAEGVSEDPFDVEAWQPDVQDG